MSGALSQIIALFTGGVVTLGSFTFIDMEIPETITWGGQRQMTVHKLPGGQRVIDDMGADPAPIAWSGILFGPLALLRRSQLDALKQTGGMIDLGFRDQAFTVMIAYLTFREVRKHVEYSISCTVLPDPAPGSDDGLDMGDGAQPDTPAAAQDAGQATIATARLKAPSLPVPPIPPAVVPAR